MTPKNVRVQSSRVQLSVFNRRVFNRSVFNRRCSIVSCSIVAVFNRRVFNCRCSMVGVQSSRVQLTGHRFFLAGPVAKRLPPEATNRMLTSSIVKQATFRRPHRLSSEVTTSSYLQPTLLVDLPWRGLSAILASLGGLFFELQPQTKNRTAVSYILRPWRTMEVRMLQRPQERSD